MALIYARKEGPRHGLSRFYGGGRPGRTAANEAAASAIRRAAGIKNGGVRRVTLRRPGGLDGGSSSAGSGAFAATIVWAGARPMANKREGPASAKRRRTPATAAHVLRASATSLVITRMVSPGAKAAIAVRLKHGGVNGASVATLRLTRRTARAGNGRAAAIAAGITASGPGRCRARFDRTAQKARPRPAGGPASCSSRRGVGLLTPTRASGCGQTAL